LSHIYLVKTATDEQKKTRVSASWCQKEILILFTYSQWSSVSTRNRV